MLKMQKTILVLFVLFTIATSSTVESIDSIADVVSIHSELMQLKTELKKDEHSIRSVQEITRFLKNTLRSLVNAQTQHEKICQL